MYFSSEITRPGCIAKHLFGTVTLCLQKIRKFIAETNVQKVYITFESQGLGCDQDLMVFLTRTQYQYTVIKLMLIIMRRNVLYLAFIKCNSSMMRSVYYICKEVRFC